MAVSLTWGILFFTNSLTVWNACILLILHGMAGALWAPPEQLLLEDFVGVEDLPSAIRLNSTARSLGVLAGPVVGSALLLGLGPVHGIWVNIAFYLPLTVLMARTKFTGHTRTGIVARERVTALAAVKVFREVSRDRVLASMIILAGLGSFFVGSAMQVVMPEIAVDHDRPVQRHRLRRAAVRQRPRRRARRPAARGHRLDQALGPRRRSGPP